MVWGGGKLCAECRKNGLPIIVVRERYDGFYAGSGKLQVLAFPYPTLTVALLTPRT